MSGQSRFSQSSRAGGLRAATLTGLAALTLVVGGCGNKTVQEMVGYDRSTPDEFAVMPRAPLEMPASLSELPPPRPGAPRPQESAPREQAEAILFGQGQKLQRPTEPAGVSSRVGTGLLAQAGQADPNIRTTVDQETSEERKTDEGFIDRLLFWQSSPLPGTVVDPYKESARLNTNVDQGKPLSTGDTPIIIRRRRAPMEGIF